MRQEQFSNFQFAKAHLGHGLITIQYEIRTIQQLFNGGMSANTIAYNNSI
jgi:hypothetical protein